MPYNERIKSLCPIRHYVRDFFILGFKGQNDFPEMKDRNFYNILQRVRSWLEEYLRNPTPNTYALSIESRYQKENPLYSVFCTKSFTKNDLLLHFYLVFFLKDGPVKATTLYEKLQEFCDDHSIGVLAEKTMNKKCNEYTALGIFRKEKAGRDVTFALSSPLPLSGTADALVLASETMPVGVLGFFLHHKTTPSTLPLTFKHHYLFQALDGEIAYALLLGIHERKAVKIILEENEEEQLISPAKLYISRESGREHILCIEKESPYFLRLDKIVTAKLTTHSRHTKIPDIVSHVWGVSNSDNMKRTWHVKISIHVGPGEEFIVRRLSREKRCGTVSQACENLWIYEADVCDPREMIPWIRTYIGRIISLESDHLDFLKRFKEDLPAFLEHFKDAETVVPPQQDLPCKSIEKTENASHETSAKDSEQFIFHEANGAYFCIIRKLLAKAAEAPVSIADLSVLIDENGFSETSLSLSLKELEAPNGEWPLLKDGMSILKDPETKKEKSEPYTPPILFTDPERRFLKSCLADPRVLLFLSKETHATLSDALSDIPPLWTSEDIIYYDRYTEGDPFTDIGYCVTFRKLLTAIREKKKVRISYRRRKDETQKEYTGSPISLEYSAKDDVFRLRFLVSDSLMTLLVSGIDEVAVTDELAAEIKDGPKTKSTIVEIADERSALSRAMLSFSDLKKETKACGNGRYRVTLHYETADEVEILIRLLSFGPFLRIISPDDLRQKWENRIRKQIELFKKN